MTEKTAPRLSAKTLHLAKQGVVLPTYDRAKTSIGIVHFGPGAFHRGHQACYFDSLLASDPRWAISGAELMPNGLAEAAVEQDHLYVVAQLDAQLRYRVVGSHTEYLKAHGQTEAIFARLMDPRVKLATMTVTEKGYYLGGDGKLDLSNPAIKADLENPHAPKTVIGWVTEGLARRKAAKMVPFVPVSCDNMVMNGHKLHAAVLAFAEARGDKDLLAWITDNVRFPSTMVDSITPAATDELKARIEAETGLRDEAPVQREAFLQWVVEDMLGEDAPDLASVGVLMVKDVAAYEFAKLRLLNGAHSTLAYAGLMRGRESVGEAMADGKLSHAVERMMREDMVPTLHPAPGLDFSSYITDLLNRFRNPALTHKLIQIASDGSLKLPIRILGPVEDALAAGRPITRFMISLAAWMRFVGRQAKAGVVLADPIAAKLAAVGASLTGNPATDVAAFLALSEVFPAKLAGNEQFKSALTKAYADFEALLD
ncbi:fructuronate reductase [Rhizomicrobium palustre]|uniref:Fructuronate reductase n=1 Tax=Rhizomicrobium palustre TaxID=189966 RepID=A0A846MYF4_9PROT|nr:mannitol dehydrogenase family protein [Rhizomicrobium palustre]NIK88446.1 fructuronate reductase [Rhizomicrobium palustre]